MAAALAPRLVRRGLFLDGLTYATIARNLAEGRGRFWEPFYTATLYPAFHEHPPFAFWLQSLWFRALGDRWWVERVYCAAAAAAIAALTAWTWRLVVPKDSGEGEETSPPSKAKQPNADRCDWLPVLLWILVPVVSWTIVGNLLETTVSVFTSLAVASIVAGGTAATTGRSMAAGALSGLAVVGAVLSKGPVGLFPLAAPLFLTLLPTVRRRLASASAAQWVALLAVATALAVNPPARGSIDQYVRHQLVASLAGQREVSGHSFTMLVALIPGVWLPMLIAAAVISIAARSKAYPTGNDRRIALAFTLIGLSGSLPMLVSPKQSGYYLMPAVPFLAIGVAAFIRPIADTLVSRIQRRAVLIAAAIVALGATAISVSGLPALEREPARVAALDRLATSMPRDQTVGICPAVNGDWGLHAWFARRFDVSLDASAARHQWFVATPRETPGCVPPRCATVLDAEGMFVLMRCPE